MTAENEVTIGVDSILDLTGTNREARAYAFLYAALKRTEISSNPVRDTLDCLIPFIASYLNKNAGKQVKVDDIKEYLKTTFGFDIPIYAIEQLLPALERAGLVEYRKNVSIYLAKEQDYQFDVIKSEIEIEFDEVANELGKYAKEKGFDADPPSGTWADALIAFLKSKAERANVKFTNVKGALVEPLRVQNAIVGGFIRSVHNSNPGLFSKLLNVFMGVLVEEFISSVSEIGVVNRHNPVYVFFDTTVLLRLLGCSGKLLRTATEELTQYLHDLGFKCYYLSGNEAEVANILDSLVHAKQSGREIEGESAEAISTGEVTITQLRALQNAFPERLAAMNVFSAEKLEKSALENARYQIDEREFAEYLRMRARENGRIYGQQNRENDAGYLGTIMRLRRRNNTRDLASCGYVFLTANRFLATMSRRYLMEQQLIQPQHCPPMLSVGQMATIAWLMKDQTLEPEKAGRELLANCFAAVRPDQQWFKYFREGVEQVKGDIEEYVKDAGRALALQAARRIAQEESLGDSAILRELSMAEILERAEQETRRERAKHEETLAAERTAAEQKIAELAAEAERKRLLEVERAAAEREQAVEAARREAQREIDRERRVSASRRADVVIKYLKIGALGLFVVLLVTSVSLQWSGRPSWVSSYLTVFFAVINCFSFMDLMGVNLVRRGFERLREWIVERLLV